MGENSSLWQPCTLEQPPALLQTPSNIIPALITQRPLCVPFITEQKIHFAFAAHQMKIDIQMNN